MMRITLLSLGAAAAFWSVGAAPAHARSDYPDLALATPVAPLLVGTNQTNGEARTPARRAPQPRREPAPPQQSQRQGGDPPRALPCPPDDFSRACRRGSGPDAIPDSALMRQRQIL